LLPEVSRIVNIEDAGLNWTWILQRFLYFSAGRIPLGDLLTG
jgi:hypothetical protein